jgi:uncharacterized protein (TIGR02001 family)
MVAAFVAIALLPGGVSAQQVEVTANVGWASEYLYRGIAQNTSSANAGLDLVAGSLYLGSWAADVGDGSEIDVYGGVALERAGVELSLGGTGYIYTGEFDDPYVEGNLGAGYGPFTVDLALGQYLTEPETLDYTYLQLTTSVRGAYATVGTFGGDLSGRFGEIGYDFVVSDLDCRVGWVLSDSRLAALPSGKANATLMLGISRTFAPK